MSNANNNIQEQTNNDILILKEGKDEIRKMCYNNNIKYYCINYQ